VRINTRGIIAIVIVGIIVLSAAVYLPLTLLAPFKSATATPGVIATPTAAPAQLTWPGYGGGAITAVGYPTSMTTGGSTAPISIASISKIITSLVVLEKKPLTGDETGPTITFDSSDVALTGKYIKMNGETKPMVVGQKISERDLMSVALIASANNYADALAVWAYGSDAAFVTATKTWLAAHDLAGTTLVEPTGLNPANKSTASDLVAIGQLALANPVIASIVSTPTFTLAPVGTITNSNKLLGRLGVDGIKTGTLDNVGSDLLFSADYTISGTKITVVGAILGAPDHPTLDASVRLLLKNVKAGFHNLKLVTAGEKFASYRSEWATTANAVATKSASVLVWSNPSVTATTKAKAVTFAPSGTRVGKVTFVVGSKVVVVPLVLDRALVDPGGWWKILNPSVVLR
jgi:D-alanyl-D-alanine carboxypeptidase (penicillin-binding protein 5/6)